MPSLKATVSCGEEQGLTGTNHRASQLGSWGSQLPMVLPVSQMSKLRSGEFIRVRLPPLLSPGQLHLLTTEVLLSSFLTIALGDPSIIPIPFATQMWRIKSGQVKQRAYLFLKIPLSTTELGLVLYKA